MRRFFERVICAVLCIALLAGFTVTGSAASAQYKVSSVYAMGATSNYSFSYTKADGTRKTHTSNKIGIRLVGTDQIVSTTIAGQMIKQQGHDLKVGCCPVPKAA